MVIFLGMARTYRGSEIEHYFPLSKGNTCVYQVTLSLDIDKKLDIGFLDTLALKARSSSIDTIRITEVYEWNNKRVFKQAWFQKISLGDLWKWHIIDGKRLLEYDGEPSDTTDYHVLLKEPLVTGNSWVNADAEDTVRYEIKCFETVRVPAGKFNDCLKLTRISPTEEFMEGSIWFAPGVGMVKAEFLQGNIVTELVDYRLME